VRLRWRDPDAVVRRLGALEVDAIGTELACVVDSGMTTDDGSTDVATGKALVLAARVGAGPASVRSTYPAPPPNSASAASVIVPMYTNELDRRIGSRSDLAGGIAIGMIPRRSATRRRARASRSSPPADSMSLRRWLGALGSCL